MHSKAETRPFLVIEDEPKITASFEYVLQGFGRVFFAATIAEALVLMRRQTQWAGWIIDILLPDGCALTLVERRRRRFPDVPLLFVTAVRDDDAIHRICRLGGQYLTKPIAYREIMPFVTRCLATEASLQPRLGPALERVATTCELAIAETAVLGLFVAGDRHAEIMRKRNITSNTLKTQVSSILNKTDCTLIEDAVIRVYRDAVEPSVIEPVR